MLTVFEQWAKNHSMQFSTDPIPSNQSAYSSQEVGQLIKLKIWY